MILARLYRVTDGRIWYELVENDDALMALASDLEGQLKEVRKMLGVHEDGVSADREGGSDE